MVETLALFVVCSMVILVGLLMRRLAGPGPPLQNTSADTLADASDPQDGIDNDSASESRTTQESQFFEESPAVQELSNVRQTPTVQRPQPAGQRHAATKMVPDLPLLARERKIFLSYRREDSADVSGRIYDRLTQAFDKGQAFKDIDSIPLGADFRKHLQQTVSSCDVVLVVVGDRWLSSATADGTRRLDNPKDFVRIELETAFQRDIPVIPVLVRDAKVPEETDLPSNLSALAFRQASRSGPTLTFIETWIDWFRA